MNSEWVTIQSDSLFYLHRFWDVCFRDPCLHPNTIQRRWMEFSLWWSQYLKNDKNKNNAVVTSLSGIINRPHCECFSCFYQHNTPIYCHVDNMLCRFYRIIRTHLFRSNPAALEHVREHCVNSEYRTVDIQQARWCVGALRCVCTVTSSGYFSLPISEVVVLRTSDVRRKWYSEITILAVFGCATAVQICHDALCVQYSLALSFIQAMTGWWQIKLK